MAEKRTVRFVTWLIKVVISYAVFIGSAGFSGGSPLKELAFRGYVFRSADVYHAVWPHLSLSDRKIVLTILAAIKHKENDTAEQNRGVLLAVTAILMLANLSNARPQRSEQRTHRKQRAEKPEQEQTVQSERQAVFNIFLPIAFYMLILEILTLLVCIVTFAPLSNAASNAFIFTIALTALLLLLIPLILTLSPGLRETSGT